MNNHITYDNIPSGTNLNGLFEQILLKEKEKTEIQPIPIPKVFVPPLHKKVMENDILARIYGQIQPIDFAEQFSLRKANELERSIRFILLADIRTKKEQAKDYKEIWDKIKSEKKFTPNIMKRILYVVEQVLLVAERVGSGIIMRNSAPYVFDGKKWSYTEPQLLSALFEMAAEKSGMDLDDARLGRYRAMFTEQFKASASLPDIHDPDDDVTINMNNGIFRFNGKDINMEEQNREMYFTYCLDFD